MFEIVTTSMFGSSFSQQVLDLFLFCWQKIESVDRITIYTESDFYPQINYCADKVSFKKITTQDSEAITYDVYKDALANAESNVVLLSHIDMFVRTFPYDICRDVSSRKYLLATSYTSGEQCGQPKEAIRVPEIDIAWTLINPGLWQEYGCLFRDDELIQANRVDRRFLDGAIFSFGRKGFYLLTLYLQLCGAKCYFYSPDIDHTQTLGSLERLILSALKKDTSYHDDFHWGHYLTSLLRFVEIYQRHMGHKPKLDIDLFETAYTFYRELHPAKEDYPLWREKLKEAL